MQTLKSQKTSLQYQNNAKKIQNQALETKKKNIQQNTKKLETDFNVDKQNYEQFKTKFVNFRDKVSKLEKNNPNPNADIAIDIPKSKTILTKLDNIEALKKVDKTDIQGGEKILENIYKNNDPNNQLSKLHNTEIETINRYLLDKKPGLINNAVNFFGDDVPYLGNLYPSWNEYVEKNYPQVIVDKDKDV